MTSKQTFLTKSRYVAGLQCSKFIWLSFNRKEEFPKIDEATQNRFDEGHKVGELAKSLFKNGINIDEIIPIENDKKSKELIKKRKTLFEAGFIIKMVSAMQEQIFWFQLRKMNGIYMK